MPGKQARDAAAAADAEFCENPLDMGTDGRDLDLQAVRDFLVAEIVRYHSRDLEFTHREFQDRRAVRRDDRRPTGRPDQRPGKSRLDQPQQFKRMTIEILAAPAAPDPDIADIATAD